MYPTCVAIVACFAVVTLLTIFSIFTGWSGWAVEDVVPRTCWVQSRKMITIQIRIILL